MSEFLDYKTVCRICLTKCEEMVSIYSTKRIGTVLTSYINMLLECTSVQLLESEIISTALCYSCVEQLELSYTFREQCLSAEKVLRAYVENSENIKSEPEDYMEYDENQEEEEDTLDTETKIEIGDTNVNTPPVVVKRRRTREQLKRSFRRFTTRQCKECPKKFNGRTELEYHVRRYHARHSYKCTMCHKAYNAEWALKSHLLTHGHHCKICLKDCDNEEKLNEHIKTHDSLTSRYICKECDRPFERISQLRIHMRIHSGEKPHLCPYCGKAFSKSGNLTTHTKIHTGDRKFSCNLCDAKFVQPYALHSHMITHSQSKNYVCAVCDKAFSRQSGLRRHILSHTDEKMYTCDICDKRFVELTDLRAHKINHADEKKYVCDFCDRPFLRRYHLIVHIRTHTGERPFKCNICDKAFIQRHLLNNHIELQHMNQQIEDENVNPKSVYDSNS